MTDQLPLPAEMALLLHRPDGGTWNSRANVTTAAAEVGELALLGRISSAGGTSVWVHDPRPSGTPWLDEAAASLAHKAGPKGKPVRLQSWLPHRGGVLDKHRSMLVEMGLLRYERQKVLGLFPLRRYFPDPAVQGALIAEVRAAALGQRELDARLAVRCALVHVAGIARDLGCSSAEVSALKAISRGNGVSEAVRKVLASASAATAGMIAAGGGASVN